MMSGISLGSWGSVSGLFWLGERVPLDRRGGVALEDGAVFHECQLLGRIFDRIPVGVLGTTLDVVDFRTRQRERNPQADKRFACPQMSDHAVGGGLDIDEPTGADARGDRPAGLADVDHPAPGDMPFERPRRLQFDFGPGDVGDRRKIAVEVVHNWVVPFRLPIESEPSSDEGVVGRSVTSGAGSGGGSSRKSTVGEKNRPPVTAVEKSRMRSELPGGSPKNMLRSIRSVTCGFRG